MIRTSRRQIVVCVLQTFGGAFVGLNYAQSKTSRPCGSGSYGVGAFAAGVYGGLCPAFGESSVKLSAQPQTAERIRSKGFTLSVSGSGGPVSVDTSEGMQVWEELFALPDVAPVIELLDPSAKAAERRFYRIRASQGSSTSGP